MRDKFKKMTEHLLNDQKPSEYFNQLVKEDWFQREDPFQLLYKLKNTEQSIKHHPEGDVWNHTMLVVDEAAKVRGKSKSPLVFMWTALLHDIGKPETTRLRRGKITSYDHDTRGAKRSEEFLSYFDLPSEQKKAIVKLVRYHMHMLYVLKNLPFGDIQGMKEEVDLDELALFCYCDRLGRGNVDREEEKKAYIKFVSIIR